MKQYVRSARTLVGRLVRGEAPVPKGPGSLAYRLNQGAIWRSDVPEKYTRLIEHIPGERVLEIGAAEGVLALLLARKKTKVIALEKHTKRHAAALELQAHWRAMGIDVDRCEMLAGDIRERLDLLQGVDTLVAIRMIYHLHGDIHPVFEHVARHVSHVVLCGNEGRARRSQDPNYEPADRTAQFDRYASIEGMTRLLEGVGYTIRETAVDGDPVVVGVKAT